MNRLSPVRYFFALLSLVFLLGVACAEEPAAPRPLNVLVKEWNAGLDRADKQLLKTDLPDEKLDELRTELADLRLEAITREYQAKVNDLRQKYAMKVELEWIQTLELVLPVQRFEVLIKRRKGERRFTLDWNPLTRKLEQAPCEYSYTWERPREVCDEALHLVSPAAHGPCPDCGKAYCRACQPVKCPRCGRINEG